MKNDGKIKMGQVFSLTLRNFVRHNGTKNAAALAYYLLFALFPLLIFISNLLGNLDLDIYQITNTLGEILPEDVVNIIESYLGYVADNSTHTLMWFSLVFSVIFPMRAVKGLMVDVRRAYGLGSPTYPTLFLIVQFLYTLIFVIVISFTLILSLMGENVITFVCSFFPADYFNISDYLLGLWQYLRFLPMGILMFVAIGILYILAIEIRRPVRHVFPGIFLALLSWLVISVGFAVYVENFGNYSVIYGAMGAVVVLLIWLYMSAIILILGAEFNAALEITRNRRRNIKS